MLFKALLNKGTLPQYGGVPERSNGAGCKPVDFGLRKFESFPLHHSIKIFNNNGVLFLMLCGCSSMVER